MSRGRKPIVLMIGSGLHKHVLKNQRCPLSDWETLLRATAARAGLKLVQAEVQSLPEVWEQLILKGVKHGLRVPKSKSGRRSLAPHQVERHLRKLVAQVLRDCADTYRETYISHPVIQDLLDFVRTRVVHVVDLNFDDLLIGVLDRQTAKPTSGGIASRKSRVRKWDRLNLLNRWRLPCSDGSAIWKPHGHVGAPESLRLGLRDYGLHATGYAWAFDQYKAALDRRPVGTQRAPCTETWVAKIMEHECRVIGLGLSAEEWGLRWLFVQRERNLIRRRRPAPATLLTIADQVAPIGVQVEYLPTWEACWREIIEGPRAAR
jgi:hypothetical protein